MTVAWLRIAPLFAALPACAQIEACRDRGRAPIVYVDIVDRVSAPEGLEVRRPRLEAAARAVMDGWEGFAFRTAEPDETGWQLDFEVELATERTADAESGRPDPSRVHRAAAVKLRLHALGETERDPDEVSARALVSQDVPKAEPFDDVAVAAAEEAGRRLARVMDLTWDAAPEAVVAALGAEAEWERRAAIRAAGAREIRAAVPALMDTVRDPEAAPDVVLEAIGALVDIGDPEAASALIDACRRKSAPYLVQMVFALGQLGGREAEAYLFTVQSGHPDPRVRAAAEEALEELTRRREAAPARR